MWKKAGSHHARDAVTSWGGSMEIRVSGGKKGLEEGGSERSIKEMPKAGSN